VGDVRAVVDDVDDDVDVGAVPGDVVEGTVDDDVLVVAVGGDGGDADVGAGTVVADGVAVALGDASTARSCSSYSGSSSFGAPSAGGAGTGVGGGSSSSGTPVTVGMSRSDCVVVGAVATVEPMDSTAVPERIVPDVIGSPITAPSTSSTRFVSVASPSSSASTRVLTTVATVPADITAATVRADVSVTRFIRDPTV